MMKTSRFPLLIYTGVLSFIGFLLIFLMISANHTNQTFFTWLVTTTFLSLPIFIYALSFSVIMGTIVYVLVTVFERKYERQIQKSLSFLIRGEYEQAIQFEEEIKNEVGSKKQIHASLHLLSEKILQINKKMQEVDLKQQENGASNEEEILKRERLRLSRELHDSVSQQLFAAMMILSGLNEQATRQHLNEKIVKQLKTANDVISTAQSEMRALLLHLRPIELSGKSLKQGIEQLLKELQTKITIQLIWEIEEMQLAPNIEDHLFRIMQELLSNTLRHAKAQTLEVYIQVLNGNVQMRVVDDGVGFEVQEQKEASYGLKSIHERVESLGGEVKIISFKNQGTSVNIRIPNIRGIIEND